MNWLSKLLRKCICLVGIVVLIFLCACGNTQELLETEQGSSIDASSALEIELSDSTQLENLQTESQQETENVNEESVIEWSEIELTQTFRTCLAEVDAVNAPVFEFNYPDGWKVWTEELHLGDTQEQVVLWNEQGAYITYRDYGGFGPSGSACTEYKIEVTKVTDAQFQRKSYIVDEPGYENLIVVQIKVVGERPLDEDVEYTEVDGELFFAIVPESCLEKITLYGMDNIYYSFSFDYHGHYCLVANSLEHEFTEQEIQEIIAILHSFREVE